MTGQEFMDWAKSKGWEEDRFGHLRISRAPDGELRLYRFKISKIAVRYEIQVVYDDGKKDWLRLRSGYLKDLEIDENGRLRGLKY